MVTPIEEKALPNFQGFQTWLDDKQLLGENILYRGHADSTWKLKAHYIDINFKMFQFTSIRRPPTTYKPS